MLWLLWFVDENDRIATNNNVYAEKETNNQGKQNKYSPKPSSVSSTLIEKKLKPLAPLFLPATRAFTQPRAFSSDNKLPGPSWPIRWARYFAGWKWSSKFNLDMHQ